MKVMEIYSILLSCLFLPLLILSRAQRRPDKGHVRFFTDLNYNGQSTLFSSQALNLGALSFKSVWVGPDTLVYLSSEIDNLNPVMGITSDIPNLPQEVKIKSLKFADKPKTHCIKLFPEPYYLGTAKELCYDNVTNLDCTVKYSSVLLGSKTMIKLYDDVDLKGNVKSLLKDIEDLKKLNFDGVARSVIINHIAYIGQNRVGVDDLNGSKISNREL